MGIFKKKPKTKAELEKLIIELRMDVFIVWSKLQRKASGTNGIPANIWDETVRKKCGRKYRKVLASMEELEIKEKDLSNKAKEAFKDTKGWFHNYP